jgi:hypothetical protein
VDTLAQRAAHRDDPRREDPRSTKPQPGDAQPDHAGPDNTRPDNTRAGNTQPDSAGTDNAPTDTTRADKIQAQVVHAGTNPGDPMTQAGKLSVPSARLSSYAEEAAELLAGLSANRRIRKTAAGTHTPDSDSADPLDSAVDTSQTKQPAD